ncbi:hypothetical protein H5T87_08105, partial [bacterium]|nr:hypothetical protein [bacterium]
MPSFTIYAQLPDKYSEEPGFCISEELYSPGWLLQNCIIHPSNFLVLLPKEIQGLSYGNLYPLSITSPLWDKITIRGSNDYWWSSNDLVQYEQVPAGTLPLSFLFSAWAYSEPNAIHTWWISWEYSIGLRFNLTNQGRLLVERYQSDGSYAPLKILTLRQGEDPIQGWFTFWVSTIELDDRYIFLFFSEESPYLIVPKSDLVQIGLPKFYFWTATRQLFKYSDLTYDAPAFALSPVFTAPYLPSYPPDKYIEGGPSNNPPAIYLMDETGLTDWKPSAGQNMRVKIYLTSGGWARKFKISFPSSTGQTSPTTQDISDKVLYLSFTRSLNIQDEEARIRVKDPNLSLSPTRHLRFGIKKDTTAIFSGYLLEPEAREVVWGREWELQADGVAFKLRNTYLPAGTAYDGVLHTQAVIDICGYAGVDVEAFSDPDNLKLPAGTPEQGFLWQTEQGTSCMELLERIVEFTGWQLISSFSLDESGYPTHKLIYRPVPDPNTTPTVAKFWKTTEEAEENNGIAMLEFREITEPPEANEIWVCGQDYYGYPICQFLINTDSINNPSSDDYIGFRKRMIEVNASLNTISAVQKRLNNLVDKIRSKKRYEWISKGVLDVGPGDFVEIAEVEEKIEVERVEIICIAREEAVFTR